MAIHKYIAVFLLQEGDPILLESYARIKHLQTKTWLHLEKGMHFLFCCMQYSRQIKTYNSTTKKNMHHDLGWLMTSKLIDESAPQVAENCCKKKHLLRQDVQ